MKNYFAILLLSCVLILTGYMKRDFDTENQCTRLQRWVQSYFRQIIFSYFKNGRKYNNLPLVKSSSYYNETVYPITTGDEPIIVSPVYKNDGGYDVNFYIKY